MSWREKLGIPEIDDSSEESMTSVTCVTGFSYEKKMEASLFSDLERPDLVRARFILNRAGVRKIVMDGEVVACVWSDLDGPEIRAALRVLGSEGVPIRYLDGSGIPAQFRLRRVPGEAVPRNVLKAMEDSSSEPWKVRDRMVTEMNCGPDGISWEECKAAALNEIFLRHGTTGRPGQITADTVRHGENKRTKP